MEAEPLFGPIEPTPLIKEFLEKNPEAGWKETLNFLLDQFPQIVDGEIQYLIDGGTAVHLLCPERRTPKDIDILVKNEDFKTNFVNAKIIDAKTPKDWCSDHSVPYCDVLAEKIFTSSTPIVFGDKAVLIVSPSFLAISKTLPWRGKPQARQVDLQDLELLSVSDENIQQLKQILGI